MSNPRLRFYPIDAFVFTMLVIGFRDPFAVDEQQQKLQDRHDWLNRLRRELLELVNFDELKLDLTFCMVGNLSSRKSGEQFQVSSSKANRTGHRGFLLIETGVLAKIYISLMGCEGDAFVVPGRPPQSLRTRDRGFVVPFSGLSKEFSRAPNWDQVARFIRKNWDVLHSSDSCEQDNPPVIAGWVADGQQTVHIANVIECRTEAISLAGQRGVNVVYSLAARSVIEV